VVERACPVCGGCEPRTFCERDGVRFVRCGACRSLYQAAEPDRARLAEIYARDYHRLRGHSGNPAIEAVKQATMRAYLARLEKLRPPGRRLLEAGCSAGAGLAAAAAAGWQAEGVEPAGDAAEIARRRSGVRAVYQGRLEDAPLPAQGYDVIVLFDVIEHIDPPHGTLTAIHRLLRPGGLVLIVTPDATSLSARWFRSRWPHLFAEHVILFSRGGLRRILEAAGFRVERQGFAWKRVNLDMLVHHAEIHPHVLSGSVIKMAGRIAPRFLRGAMVPFNIGEFYVAARRI